ncbi:MAG: FtsX-like permease family protein, partial [Pseudomonadales bacterium]|nr:FtsX-like permease family protein [Pseudomonadales bacterium]
GDDHLLETLDVDVIAGRNFRPEEVFFSNWPPADKDLPQLAILTRGAATALFPDEPAVGKAIRISGTTRTVIGVIDTWRGRNPLLGPADANVIIPGYLSGPRYSSSYLVRARPGEVERLVKDLPKGLLELDDGRDIDEVKIASEHLSRGNGVYAYGGIVLMVISALLVFTTGLGIFGVAFFSVAKRTRQIGVRRALGATPADILRYYLAENLIMTTTGVALGSVLAVALNIVMTKLGLGRVDWLVASLGILFVLGVGQVSVLLPALRASRIDPAIATRA